MKMLWLIKYGKLGGVVYDSSSNIYVISFFHKGNIKKKLDEKINIDIF
jgi:hypothetical protein